MHVAKATCFASVVDLLKCQGLSKVNTYIHEYFNFTLENDDVLKEICSINLVFLIHLLSLECNKHTWLQDTNADTIMFVFPMDPFV